MPTPRELMDRLETRHDELLRKLDELNVQIEETLLKFGKARNEANGAQPATVGMPVAEAKTEVIAEDIAVRRPRRRAA